MARRVSQRRRRQKGGSIGSWLRKAHDWIKKHKLVSRIGSVLGSAGVPYASTIGNISGKMGYGRRRRMGSGVRLIRGGSMRIGGSMSRPFVARSGRM